MVFSAANAVEGLRLAKESAPNLILLDLGLPDADGKDLISNLRSQGEVAVIVISARHQETEKVAALDAGADDYVDKPFNIDELLARIRAAQRGSSPNGQSGGVRKRGAHHRLPAPGSPSDGRRGELSPKEYDLLRTLAEHAGQWSHTSASSWPGGETPQRMRNI
jgi:two-component system KDP operon response regulator KdpE